MLYFNAQVWVGRLGGSISVLIFVGGAEERRERWNNFLNKVPVKGACAVVQLFDFYKLQKMYRIRV